MSPSLPARAVDRLHRVVVVVAMAAFVAMLLATAAQVVFRYVLEISVGWTEEAARVLFILSMFLGVAVAVREKQHVVVDFLFNRLPPRAREIVSLVFGITILVLLGFLMKGAAAMVVLTWESYMIAITWMRTGHLFLGECFAIGLMMLYVLIEIAERGRGLLARRGQEGSA